MPPSSSRGNNSMYIMYMFISMLVGVYLGVNIAGWESHRNYDNLSASSTSHDRSGSKTGSTLLNSFREESEERTTNKRLLKELTTWKEKAEHFEASLKGATELSTKYESSLKVCQGQLLDSQKQKEMNDKNQNEGEEDEDQQGSSSSSNNNNNAAGGGGNILTGGNPNNSNPHPLCQSLPNPTPSASSLWNYYIMDILEATQLPNDRKYKFHDFTTQLLQIISPRLPRSVKTIPQEWDSVQYAINIGWKRYQYLQLSDDERQQQYYDVGIVPPRPLKVLVMGGSLLVGTNCRKLLTELHLQFTLPKRDCTWSNRLGQFLNIYFGFADSMSDTNNIMFDVTKVAMGGTNTATGSVILEYDLIPDNARNPDIIINAYATNDMHILTILEAQNQNITLRDKVFDMTQEFVRKVMQQTSSSSSSTACIHGIRQPKPPPVLLHIDDYLGNEQRKIWETTELSQGVQVLANYYGFATISYADVVRDFVYGDTYESWFSANWWGGSGKKKKFDREIHPGMGMHIASTWVVVYNLLNLVTTYCSLPVPQSTNITEYYPGMMGLPPLHNDVEQAVGKPKPRPSNGILAPKLTQDLLIEDVTRLWRSHQALNSRVISNSEKCNDDNEGDATTSATHAAPLKCPFSWISGLSLQQNNKTWIDEYFRSRASTWQGWILSDDGGKIGFIPTETSANSNGDNGNNNKQIVLDFKDVTQPIQSVTFFIMKSYGTKWQDSKVRVQTYSRQKSSSTWDEVNVKEMVGFHDKNTSEMYTEAIELSDPIERGGSLRLGAQLIGGTTFKLMGLAICS